MPPPGFEPFLRAVCASPDDDLPRLVYADWLDEHGDPERAEFIRLQVADPERADRPDAPDREFELRDRHRVAWRAELPTLPGVGWGKFRRGFVSGTTFHQWRHFRLHAADAFTAAPLDEVRFTNIGVSQLKVFLESPLWPQVRRLELMAAGDDSLRLLASGPPLPRLERLTAGGYRSVPTDGGWHTRARVTDHGAMGLAWSDQLPALRVLVLHSNAISPDVLTALRERYGPGVELR